MPRVRRAATNHHTAAIAAVAPPVAIRGPNPRPAALTGRAGSGGALGDMGVSDGNGVDEGVAFGVGNGGMLGDGCGPGRIVGAGSAVGAVAGGSGFGAGTLAPYLPKFSTPQVAPPELTNAIPISVKSPRMFARCPDEFIHAVCIAATVG